MERIIPLAKSTEWCADEKQSMEMLVCLFDGQDYSITNKLLIGCGRGALPFVIKALKDSTTDRRASHLVLMGNMGMTDASIIPAILPVVRRYTSIKDEPIRKAVVHALTVMAPLNREAASLLGTVGTKEGGGAGK